MNVFLDECVDRRLARRFLGHTVKTARQMGWSAIENGELLRLAATQFDVFVTVDANLRYQQNLAGKTIPVVVLRAKSNRLADLEPLVPDLLAKLATPPLPNLSLIGESSPET